MSKMLMQQLPLAESQARVRELEAELAEMRRTWMPVKLVRFYLRFALFATHERGNLREGIVASIADSIASALAEGGPSSGWSRLLFGVDRVRGPHVRDWTRGFRNAHFRH